MVWIHASNYFARQAQQRGCVMRFDLRTPCHDCPFRTDRPFLGLSKERKIEIAATDEMFICHKTALETAEVEGVDEQACAGFLIMQTLSLAPNLITRQAKILKIFDPLQFDTSAPVFRSRADFIAGRENEND